MKPIKNNWHFARPQLAEKYLQLFDTGLTAARGLFARRRMGKTEFLKKDFIPAAQSRGYIVVYTNLWELEGDPATAIIAELYNSLKKPVAGTLLMEAMRALDKTNHRLILIIDEAQVLAYQENAHFAHALRAALDVRKDQIKVIFAGSSETTLRQMFSMPSEPFYNWAPLEPFELLDQAFVEAMVDRVNQISKYPLPLTEALTAFERLKNTPEFFRRYIEHYLIDPLMGAEAALTLTKERVFNDNQFQKQWDILLAADQVILKIIAQGNTDLYSKTTTTYLGAELGVGDSVNKSTIQNALTRLMNKNILTKLTLGFYQFEDEAFADWVRYRDN